MRKLQVNEIGTINIEQLEVAEGALEMRVPVEITSEIMDKTLDGLLEDFKKKNPTVENIYYESRLVFTFGRENPEFSLMLIVFDGDNQGNADITDELKVTISAEAKEQLRKIAWNKLGEALFGI